VTGTPKANAGAENRVLDEMQVCKAVIMDPAGRYLMQLRDDIATIAYPGHWCLFGGAVDPGESEIDGMRRELEEELVFKPVNLIPIMRFEYTIPQHGVRLRRVAVFEAIIDADEIDALVLNEGAEMRFMTLDELKRSPKAVPWDLCMVMMHANVLPYPELLSSSPALD
jgi:8-oxo-dGTP pyrophosphatase MutT (NUDIX family)